MDCPYCKEKMEIGRIMASGGARIYWMPENACQGINIMKSTINGIVKNGGFVVANGTTNISTPVNAFCCKSCKKLIINIS